MGNASSTGGLGKNESEARPKVAPKKKKIKRGVAPSALRVSQVSYGFLSRIEGPPEGPWYLRFECTPKPWMDEAWAAMLKSGDAAIVLKFLGGQPFDKAFSAANDEAKAAVAAVWDHFLELFADEETAPKVGILDVWAEPGSFEVGVPRLGYWFETTHILGEGEADSGADPSDGLGTYVEANVKDAVARPVVLVGVKLIEENTTGVPIPQGALHALHFPHTGSSGDGMGAPQADPIVMEESDVEEEPFGSDTEEEPFLQRAITWLGRAADRVGEMLFPPRLELALAGGGVFEYRGSPSNGAGGNLDNPMDDNAAMFGQPYVGVIDVGQGCCTALIGKFGDAIAYFDFGFSVNGAYAPAPPASMPCFCADPLIILSHWDQDHINMRNQLNGAADAQQWIAPQQVFSAAANALIAHVRSTGGEMCIWQNAAGASHMCYEWGFLERCTGGAINSSGIAAWVCVMDDAANPALVGNPAVGAGGVFGGLNRMANLVAPTEARAAVLAQTAAPIGLGIFDLMASYTAAALGASRYRANLMTANRCAAAANAAATAFAGQFPGPYVHNGAVTAAINGVINAWLTPAQRPGARTAIGNACLAVFANLGAGVQTIAAAVAGAFNGVANAVLAANQPRLARIIERAIEGPRVLPAVYAGAAPWAAGERFVLLTGDANFSYIPSTALAPPPTVVGLLAMHHGSNIEDGEFLDPDRIPFAPGTISAGAADAAALTMAGHLVAVVTAAGVQLGGGGGTQATVAHAAASAATALYRANVAHHALIAISRPQFAAAAAAAVIAASRPADDALVGLATVMAAVMEVDAVPIGRIVDAVEALLAIERGVGGPAVLADLRREAHGAFHVNFEFGIMGQIAVLGANPAGALTQGNINTAVNSAGVALLANPVAVNPVLREIAWRARQAVAAAPGVGNEAAAAGLGGGAAASVTARLGAPPVVLPVASLNGAAGVAAAWAATGVVANVVGVECEVVEAAVRAVATGGHASASAVQGLPLADAICYPYGVDAASNHTYRARTLGNFGHPHPLAIEKYEAKGWQGRLNACDGANHGGPQGSLAPNGDCALGWDAANDQALAGGGIVFGCPNCGNAINFQT